MYGLITLPLVPVRVSDDERSEMVTQLLFGEYIEVTGQTEKWLRIKSVFDNYEGWVDRKMVRMLSEELYHMNMASGRFVLPNPHNVIYNDERNQSKLIPGGSTVYGLSENEFEIGDEKWSLIEPITSMDLPYPAHAVVETALAYLNAPYLWGGKSVLGIDCSGLVQVVFSIGGYFLPRNAYQQVEYGKTVDFLTEARTGDLAFFENAEGNIIHVGILLDNTKVLHSSGWVKIESIDSQGIVSGVTGEYTHQLRVIKRII